MERSGKIESDEADTEEILKSIDSWRGSWDCLNCCSNESPLFGRNSRLGWTASKSTDRSPSRRSGRLVDSQSRSPWESNLDGEFGAVWNGSSSIWISSSSQCLRLRGDRDGDSDGESIDTPASSTSWLCEFIQGWSGLPLIIDTHHPQSHAGEISSGHLCRGRSGRQELVDLRSILQGYSQLVEVDFDLWSIEIEDGKCIASEEMILCARSRGNGDPE